MSQEYYNAYCVFGKSYILQTRYFIPIVLYHRLKYCVRFGWHYNSSKVQALFVNVVYEDQVLYAKRGPFRKNKTPLRGIESFSNSTLYGAIV